MLHTKFKKFMIYKSFKYFINFSCIALPLFSASAFCSEFSILVTNQLHNRLYISAAQLEPKFINIYTFPNHILANTSPQRIIFKDNNNSAGYFEIYFGRFKGDQNCTFVYEIPKGLFVAECPDFSHKISADGKSIIIS